MAVVDVRNRDRAAHGPAKLVAFDLISLRREVIARVEDSVAIELEQVAVELVRPAPGHDVDDAARVFAVPRAVIVRLHAELLQRIGKGERNVHVVVLVKEVGPIQRVASLVVARAVHVDVRRSRQLGLSGRGVGRDAAHAGHEVHGLDGVAAVERQFHHALTLNDVAQSLRGRVHERSALADDDGLNCRADLELDVDGRSLVRQQGHALLHRLLESRSFDGERVLRRPQVRDDVLPARIGKDVTRKARPCFRGRNFRAGNDGTGRIRDDATERAKGLAVRGNSGDQEQDCQRKHSRDALPSRHGCGAKNSAVALRRVAHRETRDAHAEATHRQRSNSGIPVRSVAH